jgi:peptidyl-prolyl cis-trans isomerase SurA
MRNGVVREPRSWREISDSAGSNVQADSGRYELTQIPGLGNMTPAPHLMTPVTGKKDEPSSFAYIQDVYRDRSPRTYKDARGFVINDYQGYLEDQWISALKKKYSVRIDEQIVSSLPK